MNSFIFIISTSSEIDEFVRVQGRRNFQPEEYRSYFEDWKLSLTPKSGKLIIYELVL